MADSQHPMPAGYAGNPPTESAPATPVAIKAGAGDGDDNALAKPARPSNASAAIPYT